MNFNGIKSGNGYKHHAFKEPRTPKTGKQSHLPENKRI
jgi:hypothetical protein